MKDRRLREVLEQAEIIRRPCPDVSGDIDVGTNVKRYLRFEHVDPNELKRQVQYLTWVVDELLNRFNLRVHPTDSQYRIVKRETR